MKLCLLEDNMTIALINHNSRGYLHRPSQDVSVCPHFIGDRDISWELLSLGEESLGAISYQRKGIRFLQWLSPPK